MFESIAGLPTHPLIVHLAVVAVPVAAILTLIYAFRPTLRAKFGIVTVAINFVAAVATVLARSTGEAMLPLVNLSEENPGPVSTHAAYANYMLIAVGLMFIASAVLLWRDRRQAETPGSIGTIAIIVMAIAAIASLVFVFLTGHEGAVLVWEKTQ
ncbi:DUF2231 domain-containing protein [Corynebacterium sp. H113]|uniref:DUF2231 domain-containing protein n=1 Tax=Corynebacterium sp. H113 TaxID=3133419 RepID=UPI0030AECF58